MELRPNIKEILSGFEPVRPLGVGGMASIHLYENRVTGENIVVKTLLPQICGNKDSVDRFFHEVQASLRLDHKNIVKVYGYGNLNARPSMVMEFVDGGDLKSLMDRVGEFPMEVAAYIAMNVFKGLDYSHRVGIIHRDVKPSNIMIDRMGAVKIADFGISRVSDLTRLTRSGEVLGTPAYMSPEQAEGKKIDERSDLFSMGVVLYEMVAGENPFIGENPSITLLNIIRCNPKPVFEVNPTVSPGIEAALDRLLSREPLRRYSSASEAAQVMRECIPEISKDFEQKDFHRFLLDPEKYISEQNAAKARIFLESGRELYLKDKAHPEMAMLEFHRSLFLDPGNVEAQQYITSITEKFVAKKSAGQTRKILELEEALKKDPTNVPVLLQLVKRYRNEGDIIKAIAFSKRIACIRPKDAYILGQINTLLPHDQITHISSDPSQTGNRTITSVDTHTEIKPLPVSSHRSAPRSKRISRGLDPYYAIFIVVLIVAVISAVFLARQFRSASNRLDKELPGILSEMQKKILPPDQSGVSHTEDLKPALIGRPLEIVTNARNALEHGDNSKAAGYYYQFLAEYPNHKEADTIRLRLAQLLFRDGDLDQAVSVLDKEISQGNNEKLRIYARLRKIQMLHERGRNEDARWECLHLEPDYRKLGSSGEQISYLMIYANLCESVGDDSKAVLLYDKVIHDYGDLEKALEARLLKADCLIRQGDALEAQRELQKVKAQSRPESFKYQSADAKLKQLQLNP